MNRRNVIAAAAFAAVLPLSVCSGCTARKPASGENMPETDELTEYFETGSEVLLQGIEIVEATEVTDE